MDKEKGLYYWTNFYNKHQGICQGDKCLVSGRCVMKLWAEGVDEKGKLQYNPVRMKILEGLAKITIDANKQIENLFNEAPRIGEEKLPEGAPTFYLKLFGCSSHKSIPLDYGD